MKIPTPKEIVQESENETIGPNLDEKVMFEKTTIQQSWYSYSKEPCSYDSKQFQKCHIKFNQCYLEKLIKLKPNFEFEDLKMSGEAELGMN